MAARFQKILNPGPAEILKDFATHGPDARRFQKNQKNQNRKATANMGGKGSGGNRIGCGRKRKSAFEHLVTGAPGHRGGARLLTHPSASAGNVTAPVELEAFDAPAAWHAAAAALVPLVADLAFLEAARGPLEPNPQIAELRHQIGALEAEAQALIVWQELAPEAFKARTLTKATALNFRMLCRSIVLEQQLAVSVDKGAADHRGLMQRIDIELLRFCLSPIGKALYEAAPVVVNPLARFLKKGTT